MNNLIKRQSSGFTIVELLIVIVVIGILAAITIVAYTGITTQANANAAKSNASSVRDAATSAFTMTGSYPAISGSSFTVTSNSITVSSPSGVTLQGTALNGADSNTTVVYVRTTGNTGACIAVKPVGSAGQVYYTGDATTIGTYLTGTAAVTCS